MQAELRHGRSFDFRFQIRPRTVQGSEVGLTHRECQLGSGPIATNRRRAWIHLGS